MASGILLRGALLLACLVAGCGLPDRRPDLAPPIARNPNDVLDEFSFAVPSSRTAAFRGYEVYYRFFRAGAPVERDLESREELTEREFHRLARSEDRVTQLNLPLIDRPEAGAEVVLQFDPVGGGDPVAQFRNENGNVRRIALRRGGTDDNGAFKRFSCAAFDADHDRDLNGVADVLTSDCSAPLQLALYAFAYGSADRVTAYSRAVFLGAIEVTFQRQ